jgi:hypothetical protein
LLPGRGVGRRDPLQPSPGEPAAGLRVARPRLARSPPARFFTAGTGRAGEPQGLGPLGRRTASLNFFFFFFSVGYWQFKAKPLKCITCKVSLFFFFHLCTSLHRALYLQGVLSSLAGRAGVCVCVCVCERWKCVRLGECCLGRADGRLGRHSLLSSRGGHCGEEMGFSLEFRKYWAGSWGQARACRDRGKSPVSQTCSLGSLATWAAAVYS